MKGSPQLLLRATAPLLVASTAVVFVSGVLLLIGGPKWRSSVFPLHKLSFFAWLAFFAIHVLGHPPQIGPALRSDARGGAPVRGRGGRLLALAVALAAGLAIALLVIPQFHAWGPAVSHHHFHGDG